MKILILNCGSSSVKYQLMDIKNEETNLLAKGLLDRVGMKNSVLSHTKIGCEKFKVTKNIPNHVEGIGFILDTLTDPEIGVLKDINEIKAAGHRVVHGGESFSTSVLIDEEVKKDIENCSVFAPLHNPHNLTGILAIEKILPQIPQVAVFDTSFHQSIPKHAYLYALPYMAYQKHRIRRYGFHGTSHKFVAEKACKMLGLNIEETKIITCHLGNGASITAVKNGKSIETSMGFTPEEGLIMGTRCGDVGIGAFLYLTEKENLNFKEANDLVNKKSGILGLTGISSDMRDVELAAEEGNERAQLALTMYDYRIKKYIGSYAAVMGGVDIIVFTGGIGENADITRAGIIQDMEYLGIDFDFEKNKGVREKDIVLTKENSKVKVIVAMTNEELVIAQDTYRIIKEQFKIK